METCSCAHEEQNKHLKSRIIKLEIMLEKERKLRMAASPLTSSSSPFAQNYIPRQTPPIDPTTTDVYKNVILELDHERQVKVDLLANLKATTTANDAVRAQLLQELTEVKTSRDALLVESEELQDEFYNIRAMLQSQIKSIDEAQRSDQDATEAIFDLDPAESLITESKLTAISLKSLVYQIEKVHDHRMRKMLNSIAEQCPDARLSSDSMEDLTEIENLLKDCLSSMIDRTISNDTIRLMLDTAITKGAEGDRNLPVDRVCVGLVDFASETKRRLESLEVLARRSLYHAVPSVFQDLFGLLNRSSSFVFPSEPTELDETSQLSYAAYLTSQGTAVSHTIRKYIVSHQKSRQKISYRAFSAGDLALFLPTRNDNSPAWAAFNVGAPHYFLDMEGVDTEGKDFLIGRIQEIKEHLGESGTAPATDSRKWWEVKLSEKKKAIDLVE